MKAKIISTVITGFCVASLSSLSYADTPSSGYSSASISPDSGGYSSSSTSSSDNDGKRSHHEERRRDKDKFSISVNLPDLNGGVVVNDDGPRFVPREHYGHHHRRFRAGPTWLPMMQGYPVPEDAVIGGDQSNPNTTLFVCRANYRGGIHPGKLIGGRCNISWGGDEIPMSRYEVLVSQAPLNWVASNGDIPPNALPGGYEQGRPLFICQAEYRNGMHPGKVVGQSCNIGWGGREVTIPFYNVLVA